MLHTWYRGPFDRLRDPRRITELLHTNLPQNCYLNAARLNKLLHSLGELLPWITKLLHTRRNRRKITAITKVLHIRYLSIQQDKEVAHFNTFEKFLLIIK